MKTAVLATLLLVSACASPALNAGVGITPHGVKVYPSASARIGGVNVSVRP